MSEGLSKVDQQAYRSSYRKHRERLADIRHNVTTKDFFLEAHPRPSDKKGMLRNKFKQEEIQHENSLLKKKINGLKARTPQQPEPPQLISRTQQVCHQLIRYNQEEDNKIEIQSDFSDGEPVRCIIPTKNRALSFMSHSKPPLRPEVKSFFNSKPEKTYKQKRPESFHRSNKSERANSQPKQIENQHYFHLPERNEKRQVIHHKTVILSPRQSCLYELSLIGDRMLIAAHIMGVEKYCLTELLSEKKTQAIMKEFCNSFDEFYSRVTLQQNNRRYYTIKVTLRNAQSQLREKSSEEDKSKNKVRLQNDFIKRNYYDTLKREEDHQSEGSIPKPTITHSKLEDLVQRLAAPKRYLIKDHVYHASPQPPPLPPPKPQTISKISIHVQPKDSEERAAKMRQQALQIEAENRPDGFEQEPKVRTPRAQQKPKLKHTESLTFQKDQKQHADGVGIECNKAKQQYLQSKIISNPDRLDEEDVEYLDGDEDEYKEQFQNPSAISKSNPQSSIPIENNSLISHKSRKSQHSKPQGLAKGEAKGDSNIEQDEYENDEYQQEEAPEQEEYAEQFQS